ncbi:PucR family transcriptional regulator [Nocardioides zeae]|uniref:PucR family transcriptional regulator n=1 Tax=Nocardioides zeae TaxID=1457234 RepID=A0A6P0HR57_9ACTN|nr:helix-turn-helix domain-containing protein [Nocardioides zeae]NEN80640.1 PucR family transcriptional regulator [Nocardioides zeae]
MIDALQELVEALAEDLGRSVAVDDPGLRLLASSAHYEDVDRARLGSLIGRRVAGPTRDYVMQQGLQSWRVPTRLERNPEVGIEHDRLGFPLRSRYELLGFLWLIDDGTLTDEHVRLASETATRVQEMLVRKSQTQLDADIEIEAIVLGLLLSDRASRLQAATDLVDLGLFPRAEHFSVVVARVATEPGGPSPLTVRDATRRGIAGALQGHLRESYAFSVGADQTILVVGHRTPPPDHVLTSTGTALHADIAKAAAEVAAITTIGVGKPVADLAEAIQSFDQAVVAAQVAEGRGQSVALWANHPLDAALRSWLAPQLRNPLLPDLVRTFAEQPEETIAMVEAYLDAGTNVSVAAAALHLHRTTVYYRLARLKETAGIDLDDGATRLLVHLWLKARRIRPTVD